jgi:hypothetical protein
MRATLAHPAQKRLYAQCAHLACNPFGGQCQGIHPVRQAHQVVVTLHRVPGIREGVFVVVALALFDQEAGLDTPTLAGCQGYSARGRCRGPGAGWIATRAGSAYR